MKLSSILYLLLAIPLVYFGYQAYQNNGENALMIVPFVVGLAATYVMSPHLDWLFAKRFPPKLPEPFIKNLIENNPFYNALNEEEKKEFEKRISLIKLSKDFDGRPEHVIPYDVTHGIASSIATLSFYQEDFMLKAYEKIIVYKTSFPSPKYLKHVHACELDSEDKCILIATDKLMLGLNKPKQYFNISLYVFAMVFEEINQITLSWGKEEALFEQMAKLLNFNKDALQGYIGLPFVNNFALVATCFFTQPKKLKDEYPKLYSDLKLIFNIPREF